MVDVRHAHAHVFEMMAQHGLIGAGWRLEWDRRAGVAGTTNYRTRTITLSALAVERWDWPLVVELGVHEIAHALVGPGFGHGPKWAGQVRRLGGMPLKHCPTFSTPGEKVKTKFTNPGNLGFMALVVVAALIAVPPVGIVLALVAGVIALVAVSRAGRHKTVTPADRAMIENGVLNP